MSSSAGGAAGLIERELGEAIAFAAGFALQRVLEPVATTLGQDIWASDPIKALDAETAAGIVAEAVELIQWGRDEAKAHGVNEARFDAILNETFNAPGLSELLAMRRRGTITDDDFILGLRKAKHAERWDDGLRDLEQERIDPSTIATAIQRGVMHDPGVLVVGPPSAVGKVPPMPTVALDTLKEAAAHGMNEERLAVLARLVGLPASPDLAARMVFRGIIERVDFDRAISEGNTRNEWAPFLFDAFREILTSHDYIEGHLRGWISPAEMYAGTAKHGLSQADTDLRFNNLGRPLAVHQVTTGLARGGKYGGDYAGVPEPYAKALRESNVRPEWGNLAYANRYTLPGAFVLRALAQGGDLTHDETHTLLLESGWPPDLAATVAARWSGGTKAGANKHVTSAETGLFTVLRKAFVNDEATEAQATPILTDLAVPAADHPRIFQLWGHERALVRATLTAAQIKKAIGQPGKDRAWALTRLEELGYTAADAGTFLDE